jgi:hypothetical protein
MPTLRELAPTVHGGRQPLGGPPADACVKNVAAPPPVSARPDRAAEPQIACVTNGQL